MSCNQHCNQGRDCECSSNDGIMMMSSESLADALSEFTTLREIVYAAGYDLDTGGFVKEMSTADLFRNLNRLIREDERRLMREEKK